MLREHPLRECGGSVQDEEFRDGFREQFLRHGLAVVRQRELDVEGQQMRPAGHAAENRLGLVQLILVQPRDGRARAGVALEPLHFLHLTLGLGFGARRKVFAEAFPVEAGVELKNDFPGGIREFGDTEGTGCFHDRLGRLTS
ncbi:MAG TPA: hypothetical protein VGA56_01590 [Opitutaceae bacterium]